MSFKNRQKQEQQRNTGILHYVQDDDVKQNFRDDGGNKPLGMMVKETFRDDGVKNV
jgi:hypothetical protein